MPQCNGVFNSLSTLATPRNSVVPINKPTASTLPIDTMPQRIAYARILSGHTYVSFAHAIGVHKDYCKLLENHCDRISISHLLSIARITGTDPGWLIYGNHQPPVLTFEGITIGQKLRYFRMACNISGAAIARHAFSVDKLTSLPKWESDRMQPELRTLRIIADAYGFSVMSFIPQTDA